MKKTSRQQPDLRGFSAKGECSEGDEPIIAQISGEDINAKGSAEELILR